MKSCVVIGAGNVATHLATALSKEMKLLQIYSHTLSNAEKLAGSISAASDLSCEIEAIDNLSSVRDDADFYLISVLDDNIEDVLKATSHAGKGIWAHTSGSVKMDVFKGYKRTYGVFYPLQTFSKTKEVSLSEVPVLIEGSDASAENVLKEIACKISRNVRSVDSEGRGRLHVAAVFACNFVNYLWTQADEILSGSGLDINLLRPLIGETVEKIKSLTPREAQTGPARRGDVKTIEKHLTMINDRQVEVYRLLSNMILEDYHG